MADESFMLLSLKERQSKKLAQVISNETARKILDFLTDNEFATETTIAEKLKLPLSTVHYNMKALVESKLVIADEYHYSQKGKEVPHYKLAKKFIVIAPSDDESVMDRLRKFWPISAIAVGVGVIITVAQRLFSAGGTLATTNADMMASPLAAKTLEAAPAAMRVADAGGAAPMIAQNPSPFYAGGWFVAGALFVVVLALLWGLWKRRK